MYGGVRLDLDEIHWRAALEPGRDSYCYKERASSLSGRAVEVDDDEPVESERNRRKEGSKTGRISIRTKPFRLGPWREVGCGEAPSARPPARPPACLLMG